MEWIVPSPSVVPIRDLWWNRGSKGLGRAIGNATVQRLDPDLQGRMPRPLDTTRLGGCRICRVFPTIPPEGHYFTLTKNCCLDIPHAANEQANRPEAVRAEVILLAVWRSQGAGGDPRLHTWAIPAGVVADMAQRVEGRPNRNVRITRPIDGKPTVWLKQDRVEQDPEPISSHPYDRCWTVSPVELHYIQAAKLRGRSGKAIARTTESQKVDRFLLLGLWVAWRGDFGARQIYGEFKRYLESQVPRTLDRKPDASQEPLTAKRIFVELKEESAAALS